MNLKSLYPLSVKLVKDNPDLMPKLFKKLHPHKKGSFIGVCLLEGCSLWESPGELYSELSIGDILVLLREDGMPDTAPLCVCREDGTSLGTLPFSHSVLPNLLYSRGIKVYCHLEAKEFNGGLPEVAVSIYSEKY